MYDAHVKAAEKATQEFLNNDMGMNFTLEASAVIFRDAAAQWSAEFVVDEQVEEAAERFFNELAMER